MKEKIINIDAEILGGTPVFRGTRVPIESLFDNLEAGMSLEADIILEKQTLAKWILDPLISLKGRV